jgi:hypothetical protein
MGSGASPEGARMPTYELLLNLFFAALVIAGICGGLLWSIMTQHRVPGYESCQPRHRLQIRVRLVSIHQPALPSPKIQDA